MEGITRKLRSNDKLITTQKFDVFNDKSVCLKSEWRQEILTLSAFGLDCVFLFKKKI